MTTDSLMKVENIAECSLCKGAFCNTFDLHQVIISLQNHFLDLFESGSFTQVFTVNEF